jgi:hypothetical protein
MMMTIIMIIIIIIATGNNSLLYSPRASALQKECKLTVAYEAEST